MIQMCIQEKNTVGFGESSVWLPNCSTYVAGLIPNMLGNGSQRNAFVYGVCLN